MTETNTTERTREATRRTVLKNAGAASAAAVGLAATTGSAAAQLFGDDVEEFDLDGFGAADELPNSDESELVIYLHGAGVGSSAGSQGASLEDGLADAGYDTTVVAGVFSETNVSIGGATSGPAENLADLIEDYQGTGGTARIVGYSLGGILTMQTLDALDDAIPTAATLGTGTPDSTVCEGEVHHDGIATNTEDFRVLYSENDSAITSMDAMEPDCGGFFGGGEPPETLTRVDVTHDVSDHLSYLDSTAAMEDLAGAFDDGEGDDDPDDDDDDEGFGWFDDDDGGFGWFSWF